MASTAAEGLVENTVVVPVPVWEDGVAADGAVQIPRSTDLEDQEPGLHARDDDDGDDNDLPANVHVYGANAIPLSVDQGRSHFNANVWGDVVLASPPGAGPQPFLAMSASAPHTESEGEASATNAFRWQQIEDPDTAAQKLARRGRFEHQRVRALPLRENGLIICGDYAEPPEWAWNPAVNMDEADLNAYFDGNVNSYGRKPAVMGVCGCADLFLSIMPSVSGGYVLSQENVPKDADVLLCLHKSMWRDRLVLEEGMKLHIGSPGTGSCTIDIMSISGAPRPRAADVAAAAVLKPSKHRSRRGAADNARSSTRHRRKPRHVHFGTTTEIDTGRTIKLSHPVSSALASGHQRHEPRARQPLEGTAGTAAAGDDDLMASAPIWAESVDHERTSRMLAASQKSRAGAGGSPKTPHASAAKAPRSKLVIRYSVDNDRPRIVNFAPPYEDFAVNAHTSFARSHRPKRERMLTIGGASSCDIVLPGCPVRIVATIAAFDNVFTLMAPNNLSEVFQRGEMLNKSQLLYARMTAVHLALDPERPWGVYDGDTIVVRNRSTRDSALHNCCTGLEVLLRLADPTEKRRLKLNKSNLAEMGVKQVPVTPLTVNKACWFQRAVLTTEPKAIVRQRGRQTLSEVAVEVRAPVRVSEWDGSNKWRYGATESFVFQGISSVAEATIGASRLMTLSINDAQMSRCHATIFKRGGKKPAFLMEASRSAGRKSVLRLMAASIPPGLGSAATPPHLLLAGEVFRAGASEFKIIGFTKDDRLIGRASGRSAGEQRATLRGAGLRSYKSKQSQEDSEVDHHSDDCESDAGSQRSLDSRGSHRGVSQRFVGSLLKIGARLASAPQADDGLNPAQDDDGEHGALTDDGLNWLDDDDDEEEATQVEKERQSVRRAEQRIMEERLAQIETSQFQELQSEGDEHMKYKLERPGSIPLVRHLPNQDDPSNRINIVSSYRDEEGGAEMHITNNVDKSFGLARVDEYDDVLDAFGLDEDTRSITFPDLDSFMIIQCIKGPLQRRIFLIDRHECTIGGSPACSIPVPNDPLISPIHCRIVYNALENHWRLIDCCSRMGTFYRAVAGDDGIFLQPGQRFLVGQSQLRLLGRPKQSNRTLRAPAIGKQIRSVASAAMRRGSYTQLNRTLSAPAGRSARASADSLTTKRILEQAAYGAGAAGEGAGADKAGRKESQTRASLADESAATHAASAGGCGCIVS